MWKRLGAAATFVVVGAGVALAHDMFIKLDTFFLQPNSAVSVPLLNGTFALSENSITWDRVLDARLVTAGKHQTIEEGHWTAEGDTTFIDIRTGGAGTYVLGASTMYRDFGLSAADFNAYLEHDGIPDVLAARERDGEMDVDVWERYAKHVKAVVQVGDETSGGWETELGYPAEIVPLSNPYELSVGDELAVRCLVDGKPVANQLVIVGGQAGDEAMEARALRSDDDGVVRFTIDGAGRWYVKFINMARLENDPDIDYESKWATLSFETR
jgi:hypothetical protein